MRKSPHVVGHYAAGARLIGLTEKQMAQHLATLNQSGDENSDSPYAQPVSLFSSPIKIIHPRRNGKIKLRIVNKKFKPPENIGDEGESDGNATPVSLIHTPHFMLLHIVYLLLVENYAEYGKITITYPIRNTD